MESVGNDAKSVFHEDQKFFKSDTIFVTFEIFGKCSESIGFDANNDLQEDLKIIKSDTFENYKSFVSSDVYSLFNKNVCRNRELKISVTKTFIYPLFFTQLLV